MSEIVHLILFIALLFDLPRENFPLDDFHTYLFVSNFGGRGTKFAVGHNDDDSSDLAQPHSQTYLVV